MLLLLLLLLIGIGAILLLLIVGMVFIRRRLLHLLIELLIKRAVVLAQPRLFGVRVDSRLIESAVVRAVEPTAKVQVIKVIENGRGIAPLVPVATLWTLKEKKKKKDEIFFSCKGKHEKKRVKVAYGGLRRNNNSGLLRLLRLLLLLCGLLRLFVRAEDNEQRNDGGAHGEREHAG